MVATRSLLETVYRLASVPEEDSYSQRGAPRADLAFERDIYSDFYNLSWDKIGVSFAFRSKGPSRAAFESAVDISLDTPSQEPRRRRRMHREAFSIAMSYRQTEYRDRNIPPRTYGRSYPQSSQTEITFKQLAAQWRDQRGPSSLMSKLVLHQAYQRIIGIGPPAIPFIIRELQTDPDHWFWALYCITGENPVRAGHEGDLAAMTSDWLDWAGRRGY